MKLWVHYSFLLASCVQMRGGTQYYACGNEGWNTVQYSFVMQLVHGWGVEHSTIFICYANSGVTHYCNLCV